MFHPTGYQLENCRSVRDWSRRALHYIAGLKAAPQTDAAWAQRLHQWELAFWPLEREASYHLQAARVGLCNPIALADLLGRAQYVMLQFTRFLQEQSVTAKEANAMEPAQFVPIGEHQLPPLPYSYHALEPYIDELTMHLHHDKHHKAYVDGLNKAEKAMAKARESGDFDLIKHWEREAAFNGAGHFLHTLFWKSMSPDGGGDPAGDLAAEITRSFGSVQGFRQHFAQAAEKVEGGGWAILVWQPRSHRLEILQAEKHQNLSQWDLIPLLALDVWEHAYYLKYHNDRKAYVSAWWNVVHWRNVAERYTKARTLRWEPD